MSSVLLGRLCDSRMQRVMWRFHDLQALGSPPKGMRQRSGEPGGRVFEMCPSLQTSLAAANSSSAALFKKEGTFVLQRNSGTTSKSFLGKRKKTMREVKASDNGDRQCPACCYQVRYSRWS